MRRESGTARSLGFLWPLLLLLLLAAAPPCALAGRPLVRAYTTAEGLPRDSVYYVRQDKRGFLWLFTGDGLTRFDGYNFTTYTTEDGLPDRRVNDLLESGGGTYWLATEAGLSRFDPRGMRARAGTRGEFASATPGLEPAPPDARTEGPMFVTYGPEGGEKPTAFNVLWRDEGGAVWCGTDRGLYRLSEEGGRVRFEFVDLARLTAGKYEGGVSTIMRDRRGALWVGTEASGLYRLLPDGRAERYTTEHGLPADAIASLLEDRDGNVWVGMRALIGGLCLLVRHPDPKRPVVARTYTERDGLPSGWVPSLHQTRDGRLWVGTVAGLCLYAPPDGGAGPSFQVYSARDGFCDQDIWGLAEDRVGNLWLASRCGLSKVTRNGFTAFGAADGLANPFVNSIFEGRDWQLYVVSASVGARGRVINRFDGRGFTAVTPPVPPATKYHGWGWGQTVIEDREGAWWVPTGVDALFRFPRVERLERLASVSPVAVYTTRDGLPGTEIFRLYEDSRGRVWAATTGKETGLAWWERGAGAFRDVTAETGVPPGTEFTAFREDAEGNLWIGTSEGGGLLRYRDGRFRRFTTAEGVPPGWIVSLHLDRAGRLWIASQLGGLNRAEDLSAERPRFVRYTTADGLSSNNVRCVTEDLWGRIYAGTGRGVDRLDPQTGRVRHYTAADGLPKNVIEHAYRDRGGALWFGSPYGLSRLVPESEESREPPSIYISGLTVAGVAQRVSALGEAELPARALRPDENAVGIEFSGLGFDLGEELLYQYKLEGADADWSAPTSRQSVSYASLAPGAYRFVVRAVGPDGRASPAAAGFSFTVLAPVWRRPWFVALALLATVLAAYALYRYRVSRLLEVAEMRTRIATDLHDDVGANLTRIAILSEVARRQLGDGGGAEGSPLSSIARISRESVASMSDIVWAINPSRDTLPDLTSKMRQHAEEVFTLRDVRLAFSAPDAEQGVRLGVDVRRDLLLIFKEAVNNAARHSGCASVEIDLGFEGRRLALTVADDGRGFDPSDAGDGQGLASMKRRAERLGGTFEVDSGKGRGTTLRVTIPARPDASRRARGASTYPPR